MIPWNPLYNMGDGVKSVLFQLNFDRIRGVGMGRIYFFCGGMHECDVCRTLYLRGRARKRDRDEKLKNKEKETERRN